MDAADALAAWSGRADAWFLDGFAPAVNPGMWTDALMALVAARSAAGARAATYTVAGQARRALAAAGFDVQRRPGFGRKRERLEATAPGEAPMDAIPPRVVIVGAGIAGAALARAFRALGVATRVFDTVGQGAGASGNPAALVTPRLDAGLGAPAQLHAQAFARAIRLYADVGDAVIERGVLQLESAPRDAARFAKIAASELFEPGALTPIGVDAASERLGEPAPAALDLRDALVIDPHTVLAAWLPVVEIGHIAGVTAHGDAWRVLDDSGATLAEADVVCLSAGATLARLWPSAPIQPVRGQLNWVEGVGVRAVAWGAYAAPTRGGLCFGATHDRDQTDTARRPDDDRRNLDALTAQLPALAARLTGATIEARAAIRATTPDRLPIAGQIAPGLFALGGFGSRGFALAPLLAEHVAATALGAPSPLPQPLPRVVTPERFAQRAERRGLVAPPRRV